jgi:glycolate oxidase
MPRRQPRSLCTAGPPSRPPEDDLNQQRDKCAFDPDQILNPGRVFPKLHRCAELGRMHVHHGQTRFPDLPRF